MFKEDDEEYEKRLERARNLRNSIGMTTENNNNIQINYDDEYTSRLNRAKELRNSVGMITDYDLEKPEEQLNLDNNLLFSSNQNIEDTVEDTTARKNYLNAASEAMQNVFKAPDTAYENMQKLAQMKQEQNQNKYNSLTDEQKQEIEQKIKASKNQNIALPNNDSKKLNRQEDTALNLKDTEFKLANQDETKYMQRVSNLQYEAWQEANKKNENIAKGGVDKFNEYIDTILDNAFGGFAKKPIAGLANVATTLTGLGIKGIEGISRIFGLNEAGNNLNEAYNNVINLGRDINEKANYESTITSQIDDDFTRSSGQITDVISNMIGNQAVGFAIGIPGTVMQGLSVGGSSAQEVLDENRKNIGQATVTGIAKGYISYLTEKMFDANILTRGQASSISRLIDKQISNKIKSKFGKEFANKVVGIVGENIEELVEDNVDNLIDKLVNNKDLPDFNQWWNNTTETAKVTTLSTMIMNLLGLGGETFENKEKDILADKWINKANEIIEQENMSIHYDPRQVKNKNTMEQFYVSQFNQNGELEKVTPSLGKEIKNIQPELMITPVIVKDNNTNLYEVIDGTTGVVLDNSYYDSVTEAENSYNDKVKNLSESRIEDINNTINEAKYNIQNNIMNLVTQLEQQLPDIAEQYNQNNITDNKITSENKNIDNLNNEATSYTTENVKNITDQFKTQTEYTKNEMANIWNNEVDKKDSNVIYDKNGKIKNYIAIEEDGNNLKVSQYDNNDNIVQSETIQPQNGKFTSESINNAIEKVTGVYEQNNKNNTPSKSKFYNEKPNYAVSNINEIETELKKKKSYTLEQIEDVWSDIQEKTYDTTLNDDMYVELEEDNGKLEAVLYDGSVEETPEVNRVIIEPNDER